jgi:uncharacterized transporter YbjL
MLKRIAPDKWRHFIAGIIMGSMLQAAGWWLWPVHLRWVTLIVFIVVVAISYGFELFSKITGKGRYDFIDAVASAIGGVFGMAVVIIVLLLLQ